MPARYFRLPLSFEQCRCIDCYLCKFVLLRMRAILHFLAFVFLIVFVQDICAHDGIPPVAGYRHRDSIIAIPGDSVAGALNKTWLILGAEEQSPVVAPYDGVLIFFRFTYWHTFSEYLSWNLRSETQQELNAQLELIANENELSQQFINATFILSTDAVDVTLSGFKPRPGFKLGDSIRKGDTLGTVDYFSPLVQQPAVALTISGKNHNCDPLNFIGIRPKKNYSDLGFISPRKRFSVAEMKNELDILYDLLKEATPTVHDFQRKESFDSLYQTLRAQLNTPLLHQDYIDVLNKLMRFVRDPNATIHYEKQQNTFRELYLYPVQFGILGDSLVVTHNFLNIKQLNGAPILAVDGDPAPSIMSFIRMQTRSAVNPYNIGGYSPELQQMNEFTRGGYIYYRWYHRNKATHGISLTLRNGETGNYEQLPEEYGYSDEIPPIFEGYFKKLDDDTIRLQNLSRNVALITLPRLDFGALQLARIEEFIDSIQHEGCANLIIDVRYNQQATLKNIETIFAHLAQRPFYSHLWRDICTHLATVRARYRSKIRIDKELETRYEVTPDEFTLRALNPRLCKPTAMTYQGNVYVLTNEFTQSLGSLFAALVRREKRGEIIGRETNSPYHMLSAPPLLHYELPHSQFEVNLPVVKMYFDTVQNGTIPFGRGVIPDYRIGYSIRELSGQAADSILAYTLALIAQRAAPTETVFWTTERIVLTLWSVAVLLIFVFVLYTSFRLHKIRLAWLQKHGRAKK